MGEIVTVPIVGGLKQKTEGDLSAQIQSMSNCRYTKVGSLTRRCGMRDIIPNGYVDTPGYDLEQQRFCTQVGPELISVGGNRVHSVKDRGYSAAPYMFRGVYDCMSVERRPVVYDQRQVYDYDTCAHDHLGVPTYAIARLNREVIGTTTYYKIFLQFTTVADGTVIGPDIEITSGTNTISSVRATSMGGRLYVSWNDRTAGEIYARSYDASTNSLDGATLIRLAASATFDVTSMNDSLLYVCEVATPGTTAVFHVVDGAYNFVFASLLTETETGHGAFSIRATYGEKIWIFWGGGGVSNYLRYAALDTFTYATVFAGSIGENPDVDGPAGLLTLSSTRVDATNEMVIWARRAGLWDGDRTVQYQIVDTSGGVVMVPPPAQWMQCVLSRVWSRTDSAGADHYYVVLANANNTAPSAVLCELPTSGSTLQAIPMAVIAPRQVGFWLPVATGSLSPSAMSAVVSDGDTASFVLPVATDPFRWNVSVKDFLVGLETVQISFDAQAGGAVYDRSLALVGGIPCVYGGQAVREIVPLHEPPGDLVAIDIGTGSGTPVTPATYQVRFTYQWRGDDGRLYESAPSEARSFTLSDSSYSHAVWCDVPCLHLTRADVPPYAKETVRIVAYRTVANGSVFYRASWVDYDATDGASWAQSVPYAKTARIVLGTLAGGLQDGDLVYQPRLYTEGGVLSNSPPPNATIAIAHAGRLWLAGTEDDRIWLSKTIVPEEGPGFNPGLTIDPFEGGRVRAMCGMDDKLIVFKDRSVWVLFGEGPDDRGANSQLTDPQLISSDVGCNNHRSVASTAMGLVFQATDGVPYLLTRQLQLVPIGKDIEDDFAGETVADAVVVQDTSELHLYCKDSTKRFVLDLYQSSPAQPVWSLDTLSYPGRAACLFGGVSTYVSAQTYGDKPFIFFSEDRSVHFDAGYLQTTGPFVPMSFRLGWIGTLSGWLRVKKVGFTMRWEDVHAATISVARDRKQSTSVDFDFSPTDLGSLEDGPPYVLCAPPVQKVSAIQVSYEDSYSAYVDDGIGSVIEAVTLEVEPKPGHFRQQKGLQK